MAERLLDALLDLGDLAADGGEPSAGGVDDLGPAVEAAVDRRDQARELADALPQAAQPRELVADPVEPAIELADGPEGLGRLGQLLGLEGRADLGPPHQRADVVQAAERTACRPARMASTISVVSDWRSWISAGSMLGSRRRAPDFPSEQAARAAMSERTLSNSRSSSVWLSMSDQSTDRALRTRGRAARPRGHATDRHERSALGSRPYPSIIASPVPSRPWHFARDTTSLDVAGTATERNPASRTSLSASVGACRGRRSARHRRASRRGRAGAPAPSARPRGGSRRPSR